MKPRTRKVDLILAIFGLLASFAVTFGVLTALRSPSRATTPELPSGTIAIGTQRGTGHEPSPAALDGQWLAYSDSSTCADWAGGDGVSAVRLSSSQVAWFFSDTYLGPAGSTIGFSEASALLHNSVVMQTTTGGRERFVTITGGHACAAAGGPGEAVPVIGSSTITSGRPEKYWDADGIRVGGTVVKFYNRYLPSSIPFVPTGTAIARFPVSKLSAAGHGPLYGAVVRPRRTNLPTYTPPSGGTPIIWGSALLKAGGTTYIYGWQSPHPTGGTSQLYLARVSSAHLADFAAWQFYDAGQWADSQDGSTPIESVGQGLGQDLSVPSGFSVEPIAGRYWLIKSAGAGDPDIDAYPAPEPWGPFDTASGIQLYRAPGIGLNPANDYRIMYEARVEPAFSTRTTLVISYNVNSEAVTAGCVPMAGYTNTMTQPRFIAVPKSAFTTLVRPIQDLVRAGPAGYPQITQRHPADWYNSWSYASGCPPVPAVSGVKAQPRDGGSVRLTWPSAGLGLRYRVLVSSSASGGFALARIVHSPGVTLTGLTRGATDQFEVVPANLKRQRGPGQIITARVP